MSGAAKVAESESQFSIFDIDVMHPMTPEDRADMVSVWVRCNRKKWHRVCDILERAARDPGRRVWKKGKDGAYLRDAEGNLVLDHIVPVRRGDLFAEAQRQGMSISEAREFRFDNNVWSYLSRAAIMSRPVIGLVVHPKRCKMDKVDVKASWQRHNPRDDFYFDDWRDAKAHAGDFL